MDLKQTDNAETYSDIPVGIFNKQESKIASLRLFLMEVMNFRFVDYMTTIKEEPHLSVLNNYNIISFGNQALRIRKGIEERFWNAILSHDLSILRDLKSHILNNKNVDFILTPWISQPLNTQVNTEDGFYKITGDDFIKIDKRFDALINALTNACGNLAKLLNKGAIEFAKDGSKFKEFDYHIAFNTDKAGTDLKFYISLDLQKPVSKDNIKELKLEKYKISDDKFKELFDYPNISYKDNGNGDVRSIEKDTIGDAINSTMNYMNSLIAMFIENTTKLNDSGFVHDYIINKINGVLIPSICQIHLKPYAVFGGNDNFNLVDNDTPTYNAIKTVEVGDEQITRIIEFIESIPKVDGVDYYAMDVDNFGIYGMNADGERVQAVVDERYMFGIQIAPEYSRGMYRYIKNYIGTIKNKCFFKTVGELKKQEELSENEPTFKRGGTKEVQIFDQPGFNMDSADESKKE